MTFAADVCVIGAGPAGLAAALQLAGNGLGVLLVESGTERFDPAAQRLCDAEIETPRSHGPMADAVRRSLGGTSALWGGRCVPLDPLDHEARDCMADSGWPVGHAELEPYYARACEFLGVGTHAFSLADCPRMTSAASPLAERMIDNGIFQASRLERWSTEPNQWLKHRDRVSRHPRIVVLEGWTCCAFDQPAAGGPVVSITVVRTRDAAERRVVRAKAYVIACGGVESTRLVLNSMRDPGGLKPGGASWVGRCYMGHPSGKIADVVLAGDPRRTIFGFERDGEVYVRRRITLRRDTLVRHRLLNIAFWLDNPPLHDGRHGSGVLSAAYLALAAPWLGGMLAPAAIRRRAAGERVQGRARHFLNCLRQPLHTTAFVGRFIYQRYVARPRVPGFFTYSATNRYALHYHGEQAPDASSRIELSDGVDRLGLARARIALRWSAQDVDSVLRAHEVLDATWRASGIGQLAYRHERKDLAAAVLEQAVDGFHQIGSLRMAAAPSHGACDRHGRLFGIANAFVAGSAVFPTSGQANPTLPLVALAIRQADHVASVLNGRPSP